MQNNNENRSDIKDKLAETVHQGIVSTQHISSQDPDDNDNREPSKNPEIEPEKLPDENPGILPGI